MLIAFLRQVQIVLNTGMGEINVLIHRIMTRGILSVILLVAKEIEDVFVDV